MRTLKEVLGFSKGYITIFKGDIEPVEDYFRLSNARYHKLWGWYVVSEETLPEIPAGVAPVKLLWEDISTSDETLKNECEIKNALSKLLYEPSDRKHFGSIGQRYEFVATVKNVIPIEDNYGKKFFHIFETEEKEILTWNTTAKNLPIGATYLMRGTVQDHYIYKGEPQTSLTRCAIRESIS